MKTILALDDSASIRQMVKLTLLSAGYNVVEAVDGVDGLAKAETNAVDMVVTDLNMPNMNGIEFIRALRQMNVYKGIPIVFLTTESDGAIKQEAKAAGATGWITKPFQPEQLTAVAKKVARLMTDIDPAEIFYQEAAELLEQLESSLLDLDRAPHDQHLIDSTFRALHTLKGSGAMFGFTKLAAFIHDFETAFDNVRKGRTASSASLIKVALEAKDHIRTLVEAPDRADIARGNALIATLGEICGGETGEVAHLPRGVANVEQRPARASWKLGIAFDEGILSNGSNPSLMFDELRAMGSLDIVADWANVPALDMLQPDRLHVKWTASLTTEQPIAMLDEVFMFVRDDMRLSVEPVDKTPVPAAVPTVSIIPDDRGSPAIVPKEEKRMVTEDTGTVRATLSSKEKSTIRVPAERLDEMMDRVGELVIVQARLTQLSANKDETLKSVAEDIERLTSALREAMMGIRMVPIGSLFVRFRRLLHDLSRDLGKEIELVTTGDETEMDKTMIERLADPLVHIIRNSADHGLEDPATRRAAGKPSSGRIELVARHAGAEVLLSVRDDGRGLDARRIRQKAEESGLIPAGAALPDSEIYPLIFAPGFSTAASVSALSGRGVGMDVVKKTIEAMRGSIDIATRANEGTTITLRLPLTLAIIEGLLVRVADSCYVIPLTAVEECVELSETENTRSSGRSFLNIRGDLIPFLRLRQMFDESDDGDVHQKVVIVSNGDTRIGLVVDQIIGSHQTVIKSLSKLHADVTTFSGATILGDGTVALILDVPQVVARGQSVEARQKAAQMEVA